jgi:hypothetical protein
MHHQGRPGRHKLRGGPESKFIGLQRSFGCAFRQLIRVSSRILCGSGAEVAVNWPGQGLARAAAVEDRTAPAASQQPSALWRLHVAVVARAAAVRLQNDHVLWVLDPKAHASRHALLVPRVAEEDPHPGFEEVLALLIVGCNIRNQTDFTRAWAVVKSNRACAAAVVDNGRHEGDTAHAFLDDCKPYLCICFLRSFDSEMRGHQVIQKHSPITREGALRIKGRIIQFRFPLLHRDLEIYIRATHVFESKRNNSYLPRLFCFDERWICLFYYALHVLW